MVADKIPFPSPKDTPSDDECIWAMVCHLSVLFGGVIVPLCILILKSKGSPFIALHAKQAALYQAGLVCLLIGTLGAFVFLVPLFVLIGVVMAFRARSGQRAMYPIVRRFLSTNE